MSQFPLSKSYVDRRDPKNPPCNTTLYRLWEAARSGGFEGNILNLETGERMTNLEILDLADKFAKGMLALGFKPGEGSIAVIGCPSLCAGVGMYVAANSIGVAIAHPSLFAPFETSIENTLGLADCSLVVVGEGNNGGVLTGLMNMFEDSSKLGALKSARLPTVEHIFYDTSYKSRSPSKSFVRSLQESLVELGDSISDEQLFVAKRQVDPNDVMLHLFSSGSSGHPKCIAHTYKAMANNALYFKRQNLPCAIGTNVNNDEIAGISTVSLMLAGRFLNSVMAPDMGTNRPFSEFGKLCMDAILSEKVKILALLPGMQQELIAYCEENKIKIPTMHYSTYAGQTFTKGFKKKLLSAFKGISWTGYGMSEIGFSYWTTLKLGPEADESRLASRVKTCPNSESRIVDESGKVVDVGVEGEIQYKGPTMLKSYPKNEEIFKQFITSDGFAHTGDMGVMNNDGTIVVKGRVADALRFKVFAKVVYPAPIEEALGSHPSIKDVSVVAGKRNDWIGDEVTYCICLVNGAELLDEEALVGHITSCGLTTQYSPCRILYFDAFPTTPNGRKVSKNRLREEVARRIAEDPLVGVTKAFRELAKKYGGIIGES